MSLILLESSRNFRVVGTVSNEWKNNTNDLISAQVLVEHSPAALGNNS